MSTQNPHSGHSPERLTVGRIVGVRGVKGQLKCKPETTPPDWLGHVKRLWLVTPKRQQAFDVIGSQWQPPHVLLVLDGLDQREIAAEWTLATVEVLETDLPTLPANTYRARDLEGKPVWSQVTQAEVALVEALLFNADEPFLKLKAVDGSGQDWIIPFQATFFPVVETDRLWVSLNLSEL